MFSKYCLNGKSRSSWIFYSDLKSVGSTVFAVLLNNRYQYILPHSLKGGGHTYYTFAGPMSLGQTTGQG